MTKKSGYKINGRKLVGYMILGLVFYLILFTILAVELRKGGVSMETIDTLFYTGLILTMVGIALASLEKGNR